MSNEFSGTGNVGDLPLLKTVMVGSEERQVAELRVFFDEYRQDGKGGVEQAGGFWLDVNVWGDRHAAEVAQLVKKGARVHVIGRLAETQWTVTATGEERSALHLNADHLFLSLTRLAEVKIQAAARGGRGPGLSVSASAMPVGAAAESACFPGGRDSHGPLDRAAGAHGSAAPRQVGCFLPRISRSGPAARPGTGFRCLH
jgi:single-strand DNA-binding protein